MHDKDKLKLVVMPLSTMPLSEFEVSTYMNNWLIQCLELPYRWIP